MEFNPSADRPDLYKPPSRVLRYARLKIWRDKRFLLLLLFLVGMSAFFWTSSRYPALDSKSGMGTEGAIQGIAFDIVVHVSGDQSWPVQVFYSFVNWLETNRKGMIYGILLAAGLMSILPLLGAFEPRNGTAAALTGTVLGAPLGICVNCAAPVAGGMRAAGARLETALGTMFSSPSFNPVVLTMMFTMLPWYFGAVKLAATLFFVLVVVPLLCRYVFRAESRMLTTSGDPLDTDGDQCERPREGVADTDTWRGAGRWTGRELLRNLWLLFRKVVPLMLLAGLLGAVMINFFSWDRLVDELPHTGRSKILLAIASMALIGVFLPVPMSFDVIVVAALFATGLRTDYCAALLFTLGLYSVYSTFVMARFSSWRLALSLFVLVALGGIVTGVATRQIEKPVLARQERAIFAGLLQAEPAPRPPLPALPTAVPWEKLHSELESNRVGFAAAEGLKPPAGIEVTAASLRPRKTGGGSLFKRRDGRDLGLDSPWVFTPRELFYRSVNWRPMASGDLHNDGWPDIVMNADNGIGGILIFANRGGRFVRQVAPIGELARADIMNLCLLDANNDGWLDLLFSTFNHGNHLYLNDRGDFRLENLKPFSRRPHTGVQALGFGDFDRNGELDVVVGNWTEWKDRSELAPEVSRDQIFMQTDGVFTPALLPGPATYTLSILCSDFNQDGFLDLAIADEYGPCDKFLRGDAKGRLRMVSAGENIHPPTPQTTMTIATADTNNDLKFEYLTCGISFAKDWDMWAHSRPYQDLGFEFEREEDRAKFALHARWLELTRQQFHNPNPSAAALIQPAWLAQDILAAGVARMAPRQKDDDWLLARLPDHLVNEREWAHRWFKTEAVPLTEEQRADQIPQHPDDNNCFGVLQPDGVYTNRAVPAGVSFTDFTWNTKFADFDLDGWQDIYSVNGFFIRQRRGSNLYFRNTREPETRFEEVTKEAGLTDWLATCSFTYLDFDRDGDLDIVSLPVNGPIRVFENRGATGHSIAFELRDRIGNRFGIGSKIVIRYGDKKRQIREIQPGGGFKSFDPAVAHFGLGQHERVDMIEIEWSTGESATVSGPFLAGRAYRIERASPKTEP